MRLYKKDVFYLTKAMIGLCCCKLLHPHTISIDWLNFLWHCDVGNAEIQEEREEDYQRRWKVQFHRDSFWAKYEFSALPSNLQSTNWHTEQDETKKNTWFLLLPFRMLQAGLWF